MKVKFTCPQCKLTGTLDVGDSKDKMKVLNERRWLQEFVLPKAIMAHDAVATGCRTSNMRLVALTESQEVTSGDSM